MVEFRATVHNMREKEQLYLVGGVEELGSWEAEHAKQMSSNDGKTWSIRVALRPHTKIQYKYIRIFSGDDKSWVHWEKGPDSHDREFYWNGKTTIQDDGEISSFLQASFLQENKELQMISHDSEFQEIGAVDCGENSVSVSNGWFGSKEDVPKWTWVCEMFDKMLSEIQSLERKLEKDISELSHRQDGTEKSVKLSSRISSNLESRIGDVEDKIEETAKTAIALTEQAENTLTALTEQAENTLTKCSMFEKNMHMEIDCLQRRMQKTKDDSDKRLENLEKVIDSQKCNVDSHSKSLMRLQRQINDLELKIPDDGTAPTELPSHAARVDLQSPKVQPTFEQNEGLDEWNEVASKSDASKVTGMDVEQPPSKTRPASGKPDALKVTGMDVEQPPSKTRPASGKPDASKVTGMDVEQPPSKTRPASGKPDASKVTGMDVEQPPSKTRPASGKPDASKVTGMDVEQPPSKTRPASGKPDASKVTGMDVEQPPSKTRPACDDSMPDGMDVEQPPSRTRPACGKSDDLKAPKQSHAETKSAFCGFQHPPKPEDEDIAKICSKVEEELCEARWRDLPVDARKSLLRKSLLRLHPDKGKPSEGAIWIEDWKNTHIKWYYHPHPVPEDQQKYLTKPGSTKDP